MVGKTATDKDTKIFRDYPIGKAVFAMVVPTIVSQVLLVIYNMADTWFIGLAGNADAVAAVSLALPVYSVLSAISNLFGIGGAAVLARALGNNDSMRAREVFIICFLFIFICIGILAEYDSFFPSYTYADRRR